MYTLFARKLLDKSTVTGPNLAVGEANRLYLDLLIETGDFTTALTKLEALEQASTTAGPAKPSALTANDETANDETATPAEPSGLDVDGARAGMLSLAEIVAYQAQCHEALKQWAEAQKAHMRHIDQFDADGWDHYLGTIRCSLQYASGAEESMGDAPANGDALLKFIRQQQQANALLRGPFLAEVHLFGSIIEVQRQATSSQSTAASLLLGITDVEVAKDSDATSEATSSVVSLDGLQSAFVDSVKNYVSRFGAKGCCYDDLAQYLSKIASGSLLDEAHTKKILDFASEIITENACDTTAISALGVDNPDNDTEETNATTEENTTSEPAAERKRHQYRLCRYIFAAKARRTLGVPQVTCDGLAAVSEARRAIITELVTQYCRSIPLNAGGVGGTSHVV